MDGKASKVWVRASLWVRGSAPIIVFMFVVALTLLAWHGFHESNQREVCFYGIVFAWSVMARFPGAWVGAWIGGVARHAVGWLAAFLAAGIVVLILNFMERPGAMGEDYRGGLGAAAWICAMGVATVVEISVSVIETIWSSRSDREL